LQDEKYFGTVLKCEKPEDVRCCGASTSVVTSKAILPVNLPEEYQMRVEPSPSVTVLPMEIVTAEQSQVETTTNAETPTTLVDITTTQRAPIATTSSYKHEHPVAEGRAAKFSAEEIENMKKRLREMLKQRGNPDLAFEESRFRKTYQSTEASTTSTTTATRRGRFSKKDKTTTRAALVEPRPPKVLMHKFDTRNRQNFFKISKTTTVTTTPMTTTTTESMDFEDDEEDADDGEDENLLDPDVAESTIVKQVVDAPKRSPNTYSTRGRMRYGMRQSTFVKQTTASTTALPRTRKTRTTKENSHAMKMVILEDVSNQISEKRAANEFKESMLQDFYFEKDDEHGPAQSTTERSKRAEPVYESGFVPIIFNSHSAV
jgi:hypothetical protein